MTPNGRVEGLEYPDGKHGVSGMRSSGRIVRWGQPDRPAGTAVCGPACTVVWDPWLAELPSVSHGDPIGFRKED